MLSVQRCLSAVVAAALAVMAMAVPAQAEPPPPGDGDCTLILCGLPGDPGGDPGGGGVIGQPIEDGCQVLPGPVDPADRDGLTAPTTVPGKWAYQVCGQPAS